MRYSLDYHTDGFPYIHDNVRGTAIEYDDLPTEAHDSFDSDPDAFVASWNAQASVAVNLRPSLGLGFRRRCAWCGVVLRGWQLNLCRTCGPAVREPIVRSSPCGQASRWEEAPDTFPYGRRS